MSLSNPREATLNRKNFSLRLSTGKVTWYDKGSSKEVPVDTPFRFIVLDVLNFVGGYNESSNSGIWSNEVRDTRDGTLTVRTKGGVLATGLYEDIKDQVKSYGGKFGQSVWIAYKEGDEWALGNIKFLGAGVSQWVDVRQGKQLDRDPGVAITGWEERKKGRNEFFVPLFESLAVADDSLEAARKLDEELQVYLNAAPREEERPAAQPTASVQTSFGDDNFDSEPPF